ncbi:MULTISPECIES: DNA topoisomerase IB [Chitinophagaceae]
MNGLVYHDCNGRGIVRKKEKSSFSFWLNGKHIKDKAILQRINSLAVPPAWHDVWICPAQSGHIQATGIDIKGRKQYIYHRLWAANRKRKKFDSLKTFGLKLPDFRKHISNMLNHANDERERILALVVRLMERTHIRIGNGIYEKLYGSFGLTTLKNKHVSIVGNNIKFSFKGKKGIFHQIHIQDIKLARLLQKCKDIPGKELFQYEDESGIAYPVDSGMVNGFIQANIGEDYTAKDFRTWAGSVLMLEAIDETLRKEELAQWEKHVLVASVNKVAKQLGNTPSVCKKYYIHPWLFQLSEKRMRLLLSKKSIGESHYLTHYEKLFLKMLKMKNI